MTDQLLDIKLLTLSEEIQARHQLDWITIGEYAASMKDGAEFPPVIAYFDGNTYWLADGFHRITAARDYADLDEFPAEIREGTKRDAQWYALGANQNYGVRRKNSDLKKIAERVYKDPEWSAISLREIARHTGIPLNTLHRWYEGFKVSVPLGQIQKPDSRLVTRNGTTYLQNTANIGRRETEPAGRVAAEHGQAHGASAPLVIDREPEPKPAERLAVMFSSETPEHYTPATIVELVSECMGGIDLDPCSNSRTNPNVPAANHYTKDDNGLDAPWFGTVYMNPPYGREIDAWAEKLVAEYESGEVTEAIALVPARTDTQWFRRFRDYHICFVEGRLTFIGNDDPAPFPSAIIYLGANVDVFVKVFEDVGDIWHRTRHGYCFGE